MNIWKIQKDRKEANTKYPYNKNPIMLFTIWGKSLQLLLFNYKMCSFSFVFQKDVFLQKAYLGIPHIGIHIDVLLQKKKKSILHKVDPIANTVFVSHFSNVFSSSFVSPLYIKRSNPLLVTYVATVCQILVSYWLILLACKCF